MSEEGADPRPTLSPVQRELDEMIRSVGGYWPPLAAVARLLEELGELAEIVENPSTYTAAIGNELADVWVITTAIANQFNIDLSRYPAKAIDLSDEEPTALGILLQRAGRIARTINYYAGPKTPRRFDDWSLLGPAIADLHSALGILAKTHNIDLDSAIHGKIRLSRSRDAGRFTAGFDPSTAATLNRFQKSMANTACPFARHARLWGAEEWRATRTFSHNVDLIVPTMISFTKAALLEGLDGFVVQIGGQEHVDTMHGLSETFRHLLSALADRDPQTNPGLHGDIERPGWQFQFNGLRLFVSVFSPLYPTGHSRRSSTGTFVMFQPEESFTAHGIGSGSSGEGIQKSDVREAFLAAGQWYSTSIVDSRVEAHIYLLPSTPDGAVVRWWEDPAVKTAVADRNQMTLFDLDPQASTSASREGDGGE